jgi:hypothetical protein
MICNSGNRNVSHSLAGLTWGRVLPLIADEVSRPQPPTKPPTITTLPDDAGLEEFCNRLIVQWADMEQLVVILFMSIGFHRRLMNLASGTGSVEVAEPLGSIQ